MKTLILAILLGAVLFTSGTSQAADLPNLQFQSGVNFDWWRDNRSEDARQIFVPIRADAVYKDFSMTLLTAWADTHLDLPFGSSTLDNFVDTKLMTSYGVIGKLPVDLLLGLDFNLPTGKTNLSASQLRLIMDPDLITINNFGEGFDVNPTVTVAKQWGKWVAGVAGGYLWRGSYDFSSDLNLTDYQPGAIYTVGSEVRYYFSPALHATVFGRHAWYGRDTLHGQDFFQQGEFSLFGVGVDYVKKNDWQAGALFRGIFRGKSKFQQLPGVLATEANDLEGNEFVLDLNASRPVGHKTLLKTYLQGRYFTENDYPKGSPFFIGLREKILLGVGVLRTLNRRWDASFDVRGFFKHDDQRNFPFAEPSRDFGGVSVTALVTGKF